jgi:hypothetical protein
MSKLTLRETFEHYLFREGATLNKELSNTLPRLNFSCWELNVPREEFFYDWKGNFVKKDIYYVKSYIWLGKNGAVYVTYSEVFCRNKKDKDNIKIKMFNWIQNENKTNNSY